MLIIPAVGPIRCISHYATVENTPELLQRETVYVFDGKAASSKEPASSKAFLVVTTSSNSHNYTQTSRCSGIFFYCIPNYDVDELLALGEILGVNVDVIFQRCAEISPSIRYILVNSYYERSSCGTPQGRVVTGLHG